METVVQRGTLTVPNPEDQIAAGFLAGYRGVTRRDYTNGLRWWFEFLHQFNVPVLEAKRAHAELYMRHLEENRHLKMSSICGRMSPVVGFYKYAISEEIIGKSSVLFAKRPWVERVSTTNYLTRTELIDVLNLAQKTSPKHHAVVCLLGFNGVRVSELVGIDIETMGRERGYNTFSIVRKGGKTQTLPMAGRTWWAVETYMDGRTSGPLFLAWRSETERMPRYSVNNMVKGLVAKAGITKRISPHSFRHSFITLSLDAGVAGRDVQNSSGHADSRMTSYYDRNKTSLARNATHTLSAYVEGAA